MPDMPIFRHRWYCSCWTFEYPSGIEGVPHPDTRTYYSKKNGRIKLDRKKLKPINESSL